MQEISFSLSLSFVPLFPCLGQVPQFGYSDEVDMTELVHLRSLIRERLLEQGIRFSYMPVIIKALSLALHHYPILNATVNAECTTITEKADHNIGVAMDTVEGLVVPNVKQVQVGWVTVLAKLINYYVPYYVSNDICVVINDLAFIYGKCPYFLSRI